MFLVSIKIPFILLFSFYGVLGSDEVTVTYGAAVLEYEPCKSWLGGTEAGIEVIRQNVENIINFAAEAKENNADIIVAPEYGLQSYLYPNHADKFQNLTMYVPDPSEYIVPCEYDQTEYDNIEGMVKFSCAAKELQMYLVINLAELFPCSEDTNASPWKITNSVPLLECRDSGFVYYNTEVVFDRTGAVIARYRKKNLYMEDIFYPGKEDDATAIFTTDFGVTFTLQICFDTLYQHPGYMNAKTKGIHDVVMSTAWVDHFPYFIAPSVQNGFSRSLGVNLMVSGYHWPEQYAMGSGIYQFLNDYPFYSYDANSGDVLIIDDVKTIASNKTAALLHNKSRKAVKQHLVYGSKQQRGTCGNKQKHVSYDDEAQQKQQHALYSQKEYLLNKNEEQNIQYNIENEELLHKNMRQLYRDNKITQYRETHAMMPDRKQKLPDTRRFHLMIHDSLKNYSHVDLQQDTNDLELEESLCHNDEFCCTVRYKSKSTEHYKFLVYSGISEVGQHTYGIYIQGCSVMWCRGTDIATCGLIELGAPPIDNFGPVVFTGQFQSEQVFHHGITRQFSIYNNDVYNLEKLDDQGNHKAQVDIELPDVLSIGMLGRWYEKDRN